jgi:hypothetical protein
VKLWVDDLRPAPDGWVWSKTSANTIDTLMLSNPGEVIEMSLDHDLGGEDTTRPIVLWLCENPSYWPERVRVHSANPVGVEWLEGMIERYKPVQQG